MNKKINKNFDNLQSIKQNNNNEFNKKYQDNKFAFNKKKNNYNIINKINIYNNKNINYNKINKYNNYNKINKYNNYNKMNYNKINRYNNYNKMNKFNYKKKFKFKKRAYKKKEDPQLKLMNLLQDELQKDIPIDTLNKEYLFFKKINKLPQKYLQKSVLENSVERALIINWINTAHRSDVISNITYFPNTKNTKHMLMYLLHKRKYLFYKMKWADNAFKFYPYSLNDFKKQILHKKKLNLIFNKKNFKLFKIFLRIFKQKIKSWKQQYFFIILFKNLLQNFIKFSSNKFKLFKIINLLTIKEFSYKHLNIFFFKNIFRYRYLMFQNASVVIYSAIRAFDKTNNINISFSSMHIKKISAAQVCNYITLKLGQYFKLYEILQPTLRSLRRTHAIKGFRILIVGRLTRKERAAYILRNYGSISLSTKKKYIDYAKDHKIMRFGVVGVKVWLYLKYSYPFFYTFNFNIKEN